MFARLWVASLFAEVAEWMLQIALPVFIYQATGSVSSTALTMAAGVLPIVLLSPVAGVVADRWDRRRTLWCVCLAQALVASPLLFGVRDMSVIYLVMAAQAGLASLFEPARNALLPVLVAPERITAANGMMGANSSVSRLLGSSLGGVVLGMAGLGWVIGGYLAALVVAAALLIPKFAVTVEPPGAQPAVAAWLDGLAEFRTDRRLRVIMVTLALCSVAQGMYLVLFVVFVTGPLAGGEAEVGLLRGIQAVGGLAAGILVATAARRSSPAWLLGGGALALGLSSMLTWNLQHLTTSMGVYIVLFAVLGAPGVFFTSGLFTVLQKTAAPGRVVATAFAAMAAFQVVGMLATGLLARQWSLGWLLNLQATMIILGGLVAMTGLRQRPGDDRFRTGPASRPARSARRRNRRPAKPVAGR
jgi:predicted MFS family arabinose efflux permease